MKSTCWVLSQLYSASQRRYRTSSAPTWRTPSHRSVSVPRCYFKLNLRAAYDIQIHFIYKVTILIWIFSFLSGALVLPPNSTSQTNDILPSAVCTSLLARHHSCHKGASKGPHSHHYKMLLHHGGCSAGRIWYITEIPKSLNGHMIF